MAREKTCTVFAKEYSVVYFNRQARTMSEDISVFVPEDISDKNLAAYLMQKKPAEFDGVAFFNLTGKAEKQTWALDSKVYFEHAHIKKREIVDISEVEASE